MSSKIINTIELAIWPRSIWGWIFTFILTVFSCFLVTELWSYYLNYSEVVKWEPTKGRLINIEYSKDKKKVHITYEYEVNQKKYYGDKIGVSKRKWHNINQKNISNFEIIKEKSTPVEIRFDSTRHNATYAFDLDDIFLVYFILIFPFSLLAIFLLTIFHKLITIKTKDL
jgi:lipoprotein